MQVLHAKRTRREEKWVRSQAHALFREQGGLAERVANIATTGGGERERDGDKRIR